MASRSAAGASQIDVKLLRLFDELYRTRSVSRAAEAAQVHRNVLHRILSGKKDGEP